MHRHQVADTVAGTSLLLTSSGDVGVSNDVTPFWIVTDSITPLGVKRTNLLLLLYKRQLLLLLYSSNDCLMYEAGIPLLMCWFRLFLLDSSEQALLGLVHSLLNVSIE
jgi:hypothetical protein